MLPGMNDAMKPICGLLPRFVICLHLAVATGAAAHPGHENVLSTKQAILRGKAVVRSLVRNGESIKGQILDQSWLQATDFVDCKETPEYYLIAFDNAPMEKSLYILLTVTGKYLRANFDGHFADLAFSSYPVLGCG